MQPLQRPTKERKLRVEGKAMENNWKMGKQTTKTEHVHQHRAIQEEPDLL